VKSDVSWEMAKSLKFQFGSGRLPKPAGNRPPAIAIGHRALMFDRID
jgi:hypothetical protein